MRLTKQHCAAFPLYGRPLFCGTSLSLRLVNSDVVEDLSGDEVDTSNIIEGGRRSRKGRATVFTYTATDLAEDSDED